MADMAHQLAGLGVGVGGVLMVHTTFRRVRIDYEENDHCCARFERADAWLRSADRQSEGQVGHARAKLFRSRDMVELALTKLKHDLLLFLHAAGSGCVECEEAHRRVNG